MLSPLVPATQNNHEPPHETCRLLVPSRSPVAQCPPSHSSLPGYAVYRCQAPRCTRWRLSETSCVFRRYDTTKPFAPRERCLTTTTATRAETYSRQLVIRKLMPGQAMSDGLPAWVGARPTWGVAWREGGRVARATSRTQRRSGLTTPPRFAAANCQ